MRPLPEGLGLQIIIHSVSNTPKELLLNRTELSHAFGHAGSFIRSIARVQLRDQLVECNAPSAVFVERQPRNHAEVFQCCFQSAKRCEVGLDLDRLRDTLLDILILSQADILPSLKQDAEFCSGNTKTIEQWKIWSLPTWFFGCEGSLKPSSDRSAAQE